MQNVFTIHQFGCSRAGVHCINNARAMFILYFDPKLLISVLLGCLTNTVRKTNFLLTIYIANINFIHACCEEKNIFVLGKREKMKTLLSNFLE